jgi:hypothetical protein
MNDGSDDELDKITANHFHCGAETKSFVINEYASRCVNMPLPNQKMAHVLSDEEPLP